MAKTPGKFPDTNGFKLHKLNESGGWRDSVTVSKRHSNTFTQHSVAQMLSAQQTGAKVGFKVYTSEPSLNLVGGEDYNYKYDAEYDAAYAAREEDGTEYLVLKVSYPTEILELVIRSVTVHSRDKDGAPNDDKWSAVGFHEDGYLSGSGYYEEWNKYENVYKIKHEGGVTSVVFDKRNSLGRA